MTLLEVADTFGTEDHWWLSREWDSLFFSRAAQSDFPTVTCLQLDSVCRCAQLCGGEVSTQSSCFFPVRIYGYFSVFRILYSRRQL